MKVQIETVKKYLKQYASFNYDEFIIKALKEKITISAKTLGEEVLDFLG